MKLELEIVAYNSAVILIAAAHMYLKCHQLFEHKPIVLALQEAVVEYWMLHVVRLKTKYFKTIRSFLIELI